MALRPFNVLSICSGFGGLGLGVKLAVPSAREVCHLEREAAAVAVLVEKMQLGFLDEAPVWSDVETFDGKPWRGLVDCVIAGIPCQGNSVAGKRQLERDPRNLWPAVRRILRDVGCQFFFLENVPGILVPNRGEQLSAPLARVCGELAEDGFRSEWTCLSVADCGGSQKRERVFLLAYRNGTGLRASGKRQRESRHVDECRKELAQRPSRRLRILRQPSGSGGQPDGGGAAVEHTECPGARTSVNGSLGHAAERDVSGNEGRDLRAGQEATGAGWSADNHEPDGPDSLPYWPPGPGEREQWRRILAEFPDLAPATQSEVRGVASGASEELGLGRVDQLRGLGNLACAIQSAAAFVELLQRLRDA